MAGRPDVCAALFRAWCIMGQQPINIIAMDPGARNTGLARLFTSETMGINFLYSLEEPLLYAFEPGKCAAMHAGKLTEVEAAATGACFAREVMGSDSGTALIETQPPSSVTGRGGRSTRGLTNGIVSAFVANPKWEIELIPVKTYKGVFDLRVEHDRLDNKGISVGFIKALAAEYPLTFQREKCLKLLKTPDVADALILLFSRFIELVPRDICQELLDTEVTRRIPTGLQTLLLGLMIMEYHLDQSPEAPSLELEGRLRNIRDQAFRSQHIRLFNVPFAAEAELHSRSIRRRKATTTLGALIAPGSHASPSIMSQPAKILLNPQQHADHQSQPKEKDNQ